MYNKQNIGNLARVKSTGRAAKPTGDCPPYNLLKCSLTRRTSCQAGKRYVMHVFHVTMMFVKMQAQDLNVGSGNAASLATPTSPYHLLVTV